MRPAYDAIVVGLGVMGASVADALASRGQRVLGLDRFTPPHTRGSSHGRTRIIREAYFEHPLYVPLVRRAYELWTRLETELGRSLLRPTGALAIGAPDGALVAGARRSVREHGIAHEELDATEIRRRWPVLRPAPGDVGLLEHRAGLLAVEDCLEALLARARMARVDLRYGEAVRAWGATTDAVTVTTDRGRYDAAMLVFAAGPWLPALLGGRGDPFRVERQVSFWFDPASDAAALGRCPILLWEPGADRLFYVTPDVGDGIKAALHHEGEMTSPDAVRPPDAADERQARTLLGTILPAAGGELRESRTCLYTNAPDGHFVIDRHPDHERAWIVSPCSGHGFKFAPAVGEIVADLVTTGTARFDLQPFRWGSRLE